MCIGAVLVDRANCSNSAISNQQFHSYSHSIVDGGFELMS